MKSTRPGLKPSLRVVGSAFLLLLVMQAGCSDDPECTTDEDCGGGRLCVSHSCKLACRADSDCPSRNICGPERFCIPGTPAEPEATPDAEAEPDAAGDPDRTADADADLPDAEPDAAAEADPDALEPEAEPDAEPDAEIPEADAEPDTAEPDAEAEPDAPEAEPETGEPEPEAEPEPEPEPEPEAEEEFSGNQPPVARIVAAPTAGFGPLSVHFDGSTSSDPDGEIVAWAWDFDNNGMPDALGETTDHVFAAEGTHTVTLTVQDDLDATGQDHVEIFVVQYEVVQLFREDFLDDPFGVPARWEILEGDCATPAHPGDFEWHTGVDDGCGMTPTGYIRRRPMETRCLNLLEPAFGDHGAEDVALEFRYRFDGTRISLQAEIDGAWTDSFDTLSDADMSAWRTYNVALPTGVVTGFRILFEGSSDEYRRLDCITLDGALIDVP